MQTTLLGLAIAIILALVAALVGPLLIDWNGYRATIQAEAGGLIGVNVRVRGPISVRLLPSPRLILHDIKLGDGERQISAQTLGIEFALGSLMRGQWQATDLRLVGPQLQLGLDASGRLQGPKLAVGFNPDALAIKRLTIRQGKLTLNEVDEASITLDHLSFDGEAHSLFGPLNGEGAATVDGARYQFRVAAGHYSEDGKLKLHVNVNPADRPLNVAADGMLTLAGGKPVFDGDFNLSRPVGIASPKTGKLSQPWRVSGKIKVTAARALMQNFALDYGSQNGGFKLTGVADFRFGRHPRLDGVLSGQQLDLDQAFADSGGIPAQPMLVIRKLALLAGGAFRSPIPIQLGIGIDRVVLGGQTVQDLRGDVSTRAQGWNLDHFEFRAPGAAEVRLSGELAVDKKRVSFTGPAEVKANEPNALAAWLEGHGAPKKKQYNPLRLGGQLTLASDRIVVDSLKADFEHETVAGHLAYVFATATHPARLDAALKAPDLDIDAALAFGKALLAGSHFTRPHEMSIAADIGRATFAGFKAREASARLNIDGDGVRIDKLAVADFDGASFSASGRIVTASPAPEGSVRVDLDAADLTPVMALLARFAPKTAAMLKRRTPLMAPAKLRATLSVTGAAQSAKTDLAVDGSLGDVHVALKGETTGEPMSFKTGHLQVTGKFAADDGKSLVDLFGLDQLVAIDAGPGTLTVDVDGPMRGVWQVNGKMNAGGLAANVHGSAAPFAKQPSADLQAAVLRADAAPLRHGGHAALPVTFAGHVAVAGHDVSLRDIDATVAGAHLRGKLALSLTHPRHLQGELEVEHMDGAVLLAAATGMPSSPAAKGGAWGWSSEPFGAGVFGDYSGEIKLQAGRVDLLPQLTARAFKATIKLGKDKLTIADMSGDMAGGHLGGTLSLVAGKDGLNAHAQLSLKDADAASLLGYRANPPVAGTLTLSGDIEGSGLSPVALIGSLHGSGHIALSDAQFADLDPHAFDAVARAVDQGLVIDNERISGVVEKAMAAGRLLVPRAQGAVDVGAGQARLSEMIADGTDAQLAITGNLDLTNGSIKGRLVLSGRKGEVGARPDIFLVLNGPLTAPAHHIDVSALIGWLTVRAVDKQAKQLQEAEKRAAKAEALQTNPNVDKPTKREVLTDRTRGVTGSVPSPRGEMVLPAKPTTISPSRRSVAPPLPPPVEIHPLPTPMGVTNP